MQNYFQAIKVIHNTTPLDSIEEASQVEAEDSSSIRYRKDNEVLVTFKS